MSKEFSNRIACVDEYVLSSFMEAARNVKPQGSYNYSKNFRIEELPNHGVEFKAQYFGKKETHLYSYELTLTVKREKEDSHE